MEIYIIFRRKEERVKVRLKKAKIFLQYLIDEEEKENDYYQIKKLSKFASKYMNRSYSKSL